MKTHSMVESVTIDTMKSTFNIILFILIVLIDISLSTRQSGEEVKSDKSIKRLINRWNSEMQDEASPSFNEKAAVPLSGPKWTRSSLTYSIQSYPIQISKTSTRNIFREAFKVWTTDIPLEITEVCSTCRSDFVINFFSGNHSDGYAFDGVGGTLAHAFFPEDGRICFDKDEVWTKSFTNGKTNLFSVAVHNIGHALGLPHINNKKSIMYPTYQIMSKRDMLSQLDRDAIQALYGKKQSSVRTITTIQ